MPFFSPVLLCSGSSVAICMRASSTRALSSHVYQSSSSCRKLAPVASDTFLVANLQSRSMNPGMLSRVTVGKQCLLVQFNDISCYKCQKQGKQTQSNALLLLYKINDTANKSLNSEDNLPWLTSAREGLALRFCCAFLANRVCLSSFPTSGSEIVTERMRQKLASCCWSKLWTRPDRLGMPSNWIISWKVWPDVKHQMWTECRHCNTFKSNFWNRPRLNLIWPSRYMYKCYMPVYA